MLTKSNKYDILLPSKERSVILYQNRAVNEVETLNRAFFASSKTAFLLENYMGKLNGRANFREIICKTCGKKFFTIRSRDVKYCSLPCSWKNKDRVRNIKGLWSDKEVAILKKEYKKAGKSKREFLIKIAKKLKRSRISVAGKASSLGLTLRKRIPTKQQRELQSINSWLYLRFHEHPKGFMGYKRTAQWKKTHSAQLLGRKMNLSKQSRAKRRERLKQMMIKRLASGEKGNMYSRCKRGKAPDLNNIFFRSLWERNYARYLEWLKKRGEIKDWLYEKDRFEFDKIKSGTMFYIPDFKIINNNSSVEYHEVKGWMDNKSKIKIKRMRKYYPNIKLIIIDKVPYYAIKKYSKLIPNWEELND